MRSRLTSRLGIEGRRAVDSLDVGEVSELVTTETSLLLLRLDRIHPARVATYEEAEETLRREWIEERLEQIEADVVSEWLDRLEIRYTEAGDSK